MKTIFSKSLCALVLLLLLICGVGQNHQNFSTLMQVKDANAAAAQMANPFTDFNTLEDAEKKVGFTFKLPSKMPKGYAPTGFGAILQGQKLLEVIFEKENQELRFRKGQIENISGVYTKFTDTQHVEINGVTVKISGNKGKFQLAEWTAGGYSYSISATAYDANFKTIDGGGLSKNEMITMIKNMLKK